MPEWPTSCYCKRPVLNPDTDHEPFDPVLFTILPCLHALCSSCLHHLIYCPFCFTIIPPRYDTNTDLFVDPNDITWNDAYNQVFAQTYHSYSF